MATIGDEVEIEIELPRGKVQELFNQLAAHSSDLKTAFPLAETAFLEAPSGLLRPGHISAASAAAIVASFDPVERLARLRKLQAKHNQTSRQLEHAALMNELLKKVPGARDMVGVATPGTEHMPLVAGIKAPNEAHPPFPPPKGLPFPYRGVPGVLPPKVPKPHLSEATDPDDLEGITEHTKAPPSLPKEDILLIKDGLDMSFHHLRTHCQRMGATVREFSRQIRESDDLKVAMKMREEPSVVQRFVQQQKLIYEQQRILDEAKWDHHLEEERQWWSLRKVRAMELKHIYGKDVVDGVNYSDAPPALQQGAFATDRGTSRDHKAFEYVDDQGVLFSGDNPLSFYAEDLPPSPRFRQEEFYRGVAEDWPALPPERLAARPSPEEGVASPQRKVELSGFFETPAIGGIQAALSDSIVAAGFEDPSLQRRGAVSHSVNPGRDTYGDGIGVRKVRDSDGPPFSAFAGFAERTGQSASPRFARHKMGSPLFGMTKEVSQSYFGSCINDLEPPFEAFAGDGGDFLRAGPKANPVAKTASDFMSSPQPRALTASPRLKSTLVETAVARQQDDTGEQRFFEAFATNFFKREADDLGGGNFDFDTTPSPKRRIAKQDFIQNRIETGLMMPGACLESVFYLRRPDLPRIRGRGTEGLENLYADIGLLRQHGRLGKVDVAQLVLEYIAALGENAGNLRAQGDIIRHSSLAADLLEFYPRSAQIQLWGVEALMAIVGSVDREIAEGLSGAIFDVLTHIMSVHLEDPSFRKTEPELPVRLVSALGLILSPALQPRVNATHIDFVLRALFEARDVGHVTSEHALQVFLVARTSYKLSAQFRILLEAFRRFRNEPRLVIRFLLALQTVYEVVLSEQSHESLGVSRDRMEVVLGTDDAKENRLIGVKEVCQAMCLYSQDRKVQGSGANALNAAVKLMEVFYKQSVKNLAVTCDIFLKDGALRVLLYAHQHFGTSHSVSSSLCSMVSLVSRWDPQKIGLEVIPQLVSAGVQFAKDVEIVVLVLDALLAMLGRLHELAQGLAAMPAAILRLQRVASDLVRLSEPHNFCGVEGARVLGPLLVVMAAVCSDGTGAEPGGSSASEWRRAFSDAAAISVPIRALFTHREDPEIVFAAAAVIRILSFDSDASAAHAGKLSGPTALLKALQIHYLRVDTVRQLLAALANISRSEDAQNSFQQGMPDTAEVVYIAMHKAGRCDFDVLAHGCRALCALLSPTEIKIYPWPLERLQLVCQKVVERTDNQAKVVANSIEYAAFGRKKTMLEKTKQRVHELMDILRHILSGEIVAGPYFGRVAERDGDVLLDCVTRRRPPLSVSTPRSPRRQTPTTPMGQTTRTPRDETTGSSAVPRVVAPVHLAKGKGNPRGTS